MPKYFIYVIYTSVLSLILLAVVPRRDIHRLAIYGIIFGGVIEAVLVLTLDRVITVIKYTNYGPFAVSGFPFFPVIAWTVYTILFLYFLPERKPWNYAFIAVSSAYSTVFANVLVNLGIFELHYHRLIVPLLIYLPWHYFVAWAYTKLTQKQPV